MTFGWSSQDPLVRCFHAISRTFLFLKKKLFGGFSKTLRWLAFYFELLNGWFFNPFYVPTYLGWFTIWQICFNWQTKPLTRKRLGFTWWTYQECLMVSSLPGFTLAAFGPPGCLLDCSCCRKPLAAKNDQRGWFQLMLFGCIWQQRKALQLMVFLGFTKVLPCFDCESILLLAFVLAPARAEPRPGSAPRAKWSYKDGKWSTRCYHLDVMFVFVHETHEHSYNLYGSLVVWNMFI